VKAAVPKQFTYLGLKIQGDLGPFTCYTTKRGRVVWFLKAPPKEPPTWQQVLQQNLFRYVSWAWRALTPPQRDDWDRIARHASLRITGYDLFTYLQTTDDHSIIAAIERHATAKLPGLPR